MINTGPYGKSTNTMAGPMSQAGRMAGGAMKGAMGRRRPMGGASIGPGRAFTPPRGGGQMRAPNYSGPYGRIPTVTPDMGPPPPVRTQADPLMAAGGMQGPVANTAPPMFEPPMMGGGGMMPSMEGGAMLSDQYGGQGIMAPRGPRDPRFRY
jgi:hypothetical protein